MFARFLRKYPPVQGELLYEEGEQLQCRLILQTRTTNLSLKSISLIHEPARLMILATLFVVESADFLWVERQTGLTRGTLIPHMSKLEDAGYLEITKEFVDKIPCTHYF